MLRIQIIPAALFALALAGCAGAPSPSLPTWLTRKPPVPPTVALQFVSEPPGAEVHTVDGQSCKTPCSLAMPLKDQPVSFGLNGYLPQTVPVAVGPSGEPNFLPNPLAVTLQSARPEAKPAAKPKPTKPRPASKAVSTMPPGQPSIMAPEPERRPDSAWPAPPQNAAPQSPFPPPPATR